MALCIAYLCISSFSASFCKRNIIKIIMKIRFCELSSLGAPVFCDSSVFELFPGQQLGIGSCRDPGDEPEQGVGKGGPKMGHRGSQMGHRGSQQITRAPRWGTGGASRSQQPSRAQGHPRGKDSPQTLQGGSCPPAAAGTGPSLPPQTPEQFPALGTALSFEVASPALTPGAELVQLMLSIFTPGLQLSWTLLSPSSSLAQSPALLLPPNPQCSVGLCGILNVCKKPQVFFSIRNQNILFFFFPFIFELPKQQFRNCFESSKVLSEII